MHYKNLFIAAGQAYRELTHVKKFKNALKEPRKAQENKLLQIIRMNEDTEFGRKYSFASINKIEDFQAKVPPANYHDLQPYIEASKRGKLKQLSAEAPLMFATTSGTTGSPKFIPITPSHLRDYTHAFHIHNWALTKDNPMAAGQANARYLIFASNDEEGFTEAGIPYGAISGLLRRRQSPIVQKYISLPHLVCRIKNVELKYYTILRISMMHNITAVMSCNPSTLLLLADKMQEYANELIADIFNGGISKNFDLEPDLAKGFADYFKSDKARSREISKILERDGVILPSSIWPNLSLISVWKGGPMPFYVQQIPEKYVNPNIASKVNIRDFGYMASEGRGTIPLSDDGAGGPLALTSHFFEFVEENEQESHKKKFLTIDKLELGGRYFIYFTTAAGLYRYNINDLMEVVGFEGSTPVLQFVQKGMGVSSITGEKLTEEQVSHALQYTVKELSLYSIEHFTLSVELTKKPRYNANIESTKAIPQFLQNEFARIFDFYLQSQNIEYRDKRQSGRLGEIQTRLLIPGTFTKLRQERVLSGAPEAQVKIPLLSSNLNFQETIDLLQGKELLLRP